MANITGKTLLELRTEEPKKGENGKYREGYILRVVQWKKTQDGETKKIGGPQLHKQILYVDEETGEIRQGKQKGLRQQEWQLIKANFDKIDALMDPSDDDE